MTSPYPILSILGIVIVALTIAASLIWVERRLLALWQDRYGPNRTGSFGLLQVVADAIKIFMKEDWIPPFAGQAGFHSGSGHRLRDGVDVFRRAPGGAGHYRERSECGPVVFLAMSSLGVYSVVLAGWSSDNKYALIGGLRRRRRC